MERGYVCDYCGAPVLIEDDYCRRCGADLQEEVEDESERTFRLRLRYPALRTIVAIYRILAIMVAIAAVFGLLLGFSYSEEDPARKILVAVSIGGGIFGTLTLAAASESIKVLVDIEENSRVTAELLRRKL